MATGTSSLATQLIDHYTKLSIWFSSNEYNNDAKEIIRHMNEAL